MITGRSASLLLILALSGCGAQDQCTTTVKSAPTCTKTAGSTSACDWGLLSDSCTTGVPIAVIPTTTESKKAKK